MSPTTGDMGHPRVVVSLNRKSKGKCNRGSFDSVCRKTRGELRSGRQVSGGGLVVSHVSNNGRHGAPSGCGEFALQKQRQERPRRKGKVGLGNRPRIEV